MKWLRMIFGGYQDEIKKLQDEILDLRIQLKNEKNLSDFYKTSYYQLIKNIVEK